MAHEIALQQIAAAKGVHERAFIVEKVEKFLKSYAEQDWQGRAELLSDDVIFEDTVGVPPPAACRVEAADYFKSIIDAGFQIAMMPKRIILMGNEAFTVVHATWCAPESEEESVCLVQNFKFTESGHICHVRVAYDESCLEWSF